MSYRVAYLESGKIILSFVDGSDLDISTSTEANDEYTWSDYLRRLDYVQDADYRYPTTFLTFASEEDKMFFLLKYS